MILNQPIKTPDELKKEFEDFLKSMLKLLDAYETGKISKEECLEKILPLMEVSDFKDNPYYSSVIH